MADQQIVEQPKPWPIPARVITPEEMAKHVQNDIDTAKAIAAKST